MRRFNKVYRGIDRPTDVLAFSMREGPFLHPVPYVLGDIVISAERALRQASEAGHTLKKELCILLIHGILHLLGYDHEGAGKDARMMRRKEKEIWNEIFCGLTDLYEKRRAF